MPRPRCWAKLLFTQTRANNTSCGKMSERHALTSILRDPTGLYEVLCLANCSMRNMRRQKKKKKKRFSDRPFESVKGPKDRKGAGTYIKPCAETFFKGPDRNLGRSSRNWVPGNMEKWPVLPNAGVLWSYPRLLAGLLYRGASRGLPSSKHLLLESGGGKRVMRNTIARPAQCRRIFLFRQNWRRGTRPWPFRPVARQKKRKNDSGRRSKGLPNVTCQLRPLAGAGRSKGSPKA